MLTTRRYAFAEAALRSGKLISMNTEPESLSQVPGLVMIIPSPPPPPPPSPTSDPGKEAASEPEDDPNDMSATAQARRCLTKPKEPASWHEPCSNPSSSMMVAARAEASSTPQPKMPEEMAERIREQVRGDLDHHRSLLQAPGPKPEGESRTLDPPAPPSPPSSHGMSNGAIAAIVIGVGLLVLLLGTLAVAARMTIRYKLQTRPGAASTHKPSPRTPKELTSIIVDCPKDKGTDLGPDGLHPPLITHSSFSDPSTSSQSGHSSPSANPSGDQTTGARIHAVGLRPSLVTHTLPAPAHGSNPGAGIHASGHPQEQLVALDTLMQQAHQAGEAIPRRLPETALGLAKLKIGDRRLLRHGARSQGLNQGDVDFSASEDDGSDAGEEFHDARSRRPSGASTNEDSFFDALSSRATSASSQASKKAVTPKHWRIHYTNPLATHGAERRTGLSVLMPPKEDMTSGTHSTGDVTEDLLRSAIMKTINNSRILGTPGTNGAWPEQPDPEFPEGPHTQDNPIFQSHCSLQSIKEAIEAELANTELQTKPVTVSFVYDPENVHGTLPDRTLGLRVGPLNDTQGDAPAGRKLAVRIHNVPDESDDEIVDEAKARYSPQARGIPEKFRPMGPPSQPTFCTYPKDLLDTPENEELVYISREIAAREAQQWGPRKDRIPLINSNGSLESV
ncbi:hypothetical protein WJX84_003880 [Apatococcus fuscideae]|uniref:Uncharacterized protein n=1 Tax=Apatococcus fuscideae TaxID=2026836 RepID=A0AAW1SXG4_9CHLO